LPELKKHNIKIVMTIHDYHMLAPNYSLFHHGQIHEEEARGWYLKSIFNRSIKNSLAASAFATLAQIFQFKIMRYYQRYVDVFIAPSQFIKDLCVAYGWDEKKIICMPNPVDAVKYTVSSTDQGYVAYVGRLSEEKGVERILDVAKNTPQIPYKIIGTGPLEETLRARIIAENISNVELTGFKTGDELLVLIAGSRILLCPSIWYENNPLSILEGKALAKIVLGSRIGGIPEMLPKTMLFDADSNFEMQDKINYWFHASDQDRYVTGARLRSEVEIQNNPEKYREKLLSLYAK
jgi:glycosyltransferase involved in cell wall biosynthesis